MTITDIINECDKYCTDNITLTGGEPLIHPDVQYLIQALCEAGYDVNIETNGAVDISEYFDEYGQVLPKYTGLWFTVDYKCPSSGMEDRMIMDNFDVYKKKYNGIVYKFVVGSETDLDRAKQIINDYIIPGTTHYYGKNYVYLSPVFGQIEPKKIVEYMQKYDMYNATVPIRVQLQIHKFLWDPNKRGV